METESTMILKETILKRLVKYHAKLIVFSLHLDMIFNFPSNEINYIVEVDIYHNYTFDVNYYPDKNIKIQAKYLICRENMIDYEHKYNLKTICFT